MQSFIKGNNRHQVVLIPECLDALIAPDHEIRTIDAFVDSLDISSYEFYIKSSTEGRPQYHPKDLLKLFIYGYLNSIRSSRKLEAECGRNIEVMWLLKQLSPDHNTIANFRKDNQKAIRKVFQATVRLASQFELIGGALLAGDSTKLRAQNSKKNNFNQAKIDRHIQHINDKLESYSNALAEADGDVTVIAEIQAKVEKHAARKEFYNALTEKLVATGETQISLSDPDSRQIMVRNNISEVAYSVQTVVDSKHCIPIDYKVTNQNDAKGMYPMVRRAQTILGKKDFTMLYDKGYHTGSEIKKTIDLGVHLMVAIPEVASNAPDRAYNVAQFNYDHQKDQFICPEGQVLSSNGKWYTRQRDKSTSYLVKHYKTDQCLSCPAFSRCTANKKGRCIERSEYAEAIEANRQNIEADPLLYKRRQAIVEHPYGIIKRQWGFYYIMSKKTTSHASADVGLMFTAFNLRRIFNIIGHPNLKSYLQIHGRRFVNYFLTQINKLEAFWRHFMNPNFYINSTSIPYFSIISPQFNPKSVKNSYICSY